jgi:hypothetical protein
MMTMADVVHFRGRVKANAAFGATNNLLFTLPEGMRPPRRVAPALPGSVNANHNRCVSLATCVTNVGSYPAVFRSMRPFDFQPDPAAPHHLNTDLTPTPFLSVDFDSTGIVNVLGYAPGETEASLDGFFFSTSPDNSDGWTSPNYVQGVAGLDSSNWQPISYRKVGDTVQLRGIAAKTDGSALRDVLFTLPEGMRPSKAIAFVTVGHGGTIRLDVRTNGEVAVVSRSADSQYCQVDGVYFAVADSKGWENLILAASFAPGGPESWHVPAYRLVDGRVELRGLLRKLAGAVVTGEVVARLFEATEPGHTLMFSAISHNGATGHRVEVRPDGTIAVTGAAGGAVYVDLDGISFFIISKDDVLLPLALSEPFKATETAEGFAPPAMVRRAVDVVDETGQTVKSLRVSLQGKPVGKRD